MYKIKQVIKSIWNEFVYGGHLLSLGAASIIYTSAVLLSIKITWDCLLVAYLGTQASYLFNRYKEFSKDILTNPERTEHIGKNIKCILPTIVIFIVTILGIFIYFHKTQALIFGGIVLLLSLLYSQFLKKLTRKLVGFKSFFVSLMWALLVVFLSFYYSYPLNFAVFLIFLFIFLRWVLNTSVFDIKDIDSDKKEQLLTLPVVFGEKKLFIFHNLLNFIGIIPIVLGVYLKIILPLSLIFLFTIPYTLFYLTEIKKGRMNRSFLYNVIIDGEFVLWSFFILIARKYVN